MHRVGAPACAREGAPWERERVHVCVCARLCTGLGSCGSVRSCEFVLVCEASCLMPVACSVGQSVCVFLLGVRVYVWGSERKGGHFCVCISSAWQCLCTTTV